MGVKESARQAHVLETALTVFARHGFSKTSIEDIAKAAGISRQGIYLYFKNKDEIFSASIQKALDDGLQAANKVFDDDVAVPVISVEGSATGLAFNKDLIGSKFNLNNHYYDFEFNFMN